MIIIKVSHMLILHTQTTEVIDSHTNASHTYFLPSMGYKNTLHTVSLKKVTINTS